MDPSYKLSPLSSSYRPLGSDPLRAGSSSLPNSCQRPLPIAMAFVTTGDATVAVEVGTGEGDVPQPVDCLQGTPIPPFLTKTFDLVDDPGLDQIISWGGSGESFVVWDPVEFTRIILPRNFKHNNLSSFVRQLNTYGFRKIDTDRWEFANESFLRGKRHLLRNIQRRKSPQSQQVGSSLYSNEEGSILPIETEVERLQKEKMEMMQEVINLQQQQRGTYQYMESVNEKLQAAEDRQKQMVSSLAEVFQIPIREKKEQDHLSSPRMVRKFVKHQPHHLDCGLNSIPVNDMARKLDFGTEIVPLQLQDIDSHERAQTEDPLSKGESVFGSDFEARPGCFVSSPVNLAKENTMLELFCPGIDDCRVKQEDIWSSDFETSAAMPGSSNEIWNDIGNYALPEFVVGGGELSDFWNLAAPGAESWSE